MGNKNARRGASMAFTRISVAGASATASRSGKAHSDTLINYSTTAKTSNSLNIGAPPRALLFRSYQTGTLYTRNFEPSGRISKPLQPLTKKPLSAASAVFVPAQNGGKKITTESAGIQRLKNLLASMPRSTGPPSNVRQVSIAAPSTQGETASSTQSETTPNTPASKFSARTAITTPSVFGPIGPPLPTLSVSDLRHLFNKATSSATEVVNASNDVAITSSKSLNGAMHGDRAGGHSGQSYLQMTDESSLPVRESIVEVLSKMTIKDQSTFWVGKMVEVTVNFEEFDTVEYDDSKSTAQTNKELGEMKMRAVEMMKALGPAFVDHARVIVLHLHFPEKPCQKAIYNSRGNSRTAQTWSPSYQAIENIANALKNFKSLARLDVILHVPNYTRSSFTLEQLNYALPFYDLPFTRWRLQWQRSFMRYPENIRSWPLEYLDRQRMRILRDCAWARHQKDKEIENAIFVRKSAFPAVQNMR